MSTHQDRLEELFHHAIQYDSETDQSKFLDEACGSDADLRNELKQWIASVSAADAFAETYQLPHTLTRRDMSGQMIGPYKLREKIGEGGMGVVYAADQKSPVKRRVALKVIKPGMDSRQVIARFDSERQALAMMDHPNVARILDAGTTDQGLPYFVMELVNGVPITQYCDAHRLTIHQRLELMLPVCHAVQHAHQKGIIHRDLKPSNILVTQYDGTPVPKVIDFGIAKAVASQLGDYSVYTEIGSLIGTLEYMSPEQAQRNQLDVDTRSDVYSIGVVLYEMLSGTTPFEANRLRSAAFDEMLRIIREEEPPLASGKLSATRALSEVASARSVSPEQLTKTVRGELDWILIKALEKDRNRRYESSLELGKDLERFLNCEPVVASPASVVYRTRKFARRHRNLLTLAASLCLAVSLGAASLGWTVWERTARQRDRQQRIARLVNRVEQLIDKRDWVTGLHLLDQEFGLSKDTAALNYDGQTLIELKKQFDFYNQLEELRLSVPTHNEAGVSERQGVDLGYRNAFDAIGVHPETDAVRQSVAALKKRLPARAPVYEALIDWALAKKRAAMRAQSNWENVLNANLPDTQNLPEKLPADIRGQCAKLCAVAEALTTVAFRQRLARQFFDADGNNREASMLEMISTPEFANQSVYTRSQCARILYVQGETQKAVAIATQIQAEMPSDFWCNYDLAVYCAGKLGLPRRAVRYYMAALAIRPTSTSAMSGLANALAESNQPEEAERWLLRLSMLNPRLPSAYLVLGNVHKTMGKTEEALEAFHKVLELEPRFAGAWNNIGILYQEEGQLEKAMEAYEKSIETDPRYVSAFYNLGSVYRDKGQLEEAEQLFRQVITSYPNFTNTYNKLGLTLRDQRRNEEAVEIFRKGLETTLDSVEDLRNVHINLGMTLRYHLPDDEAREAEAIKTFKKLVEIDPKWGPGHDQLSRALANTPFEQLRDPEQAVHHARRAVEASIAARGSAGAYELATLGMACFRARDWQTCLLVLDMPKVRPKSAQAPTDLFLAMATWRMGKRDAAKRLYDEAVSRLQGKQNQNGLDRTTLAEAKELIEGDPDEA